MEAIITKNGQLYVVRHGRNKRAGCIRFEGQACGDWCPAFHISQEEQVGIAPLSLEPTILFCFGSREYTKITDERGV